MASEVLWFSNLISALSTDYSFYNSVIKILIKLSDNPIKARFDAVLLEEKRLSRKILRQEEILKGWLEEAPVLKKKFEQKLHNLDLIRKESATLRIKGSESLKAGLVLLDQEKQRIRGNLKLNTHRKEAAPRLIDIKL